MPSNYNYQEPAWVQDFMVADAAKRLSSTDRTNISKKRQMVAFTPQEQASSMVMETLPRNMRELDIAISEAQDPAVIQILQDERTNLMKLTETVNRVKTGQEQTSSESPSFMDHLGDLLQNLWKVK